MTVEVRITPSLVAASLFASGAPGYVAVVQAGNAVRTEAIRRCPVDTGRLRSSIQLAVVNTGSDALEARVGTNVVYAKWVHEGRGPVRPINARVLRWKPKGGGGFIFRPYAGPTSPNPFLADALHAVLG